MLRIAGQRAGPIGLKFFVDTHGWPGGVILFFRQLFISFIFKYFFQMFPRALQLGTNEIKHLKGLYVSAQLKRAAQRLFTI